ncbi:polysaccharide pyruvyl transferase, partial [Aggregatibacter actinomycetemcomitans serotype e str. SA2149]
TRLHGHIFSSLLEIPNVVCDNAYGKNTGYANLWTKGLNFVTFYK